MEEAAAEFVKGRVDADDALIVNRDGQTAQTHDEPLITGEDAKAKIESLELDGDDDDWRVRAHASRAAAHIRRRTRSSSPRRPSSARRRSAFTRTSTRIT